MSHFTFGFLFNTVLYNMVLHIACTTITKAYQWSRLRTHKRNLISEHCRQTIQRLHIRSKRHTNTHTNINITPPGSFHRLFWVWTEPMSDAVTLSLIGSAHSQNDPCISRIGHWDSNLHYDMNNEVMVGLNFSYTFSEIDIKEKRNTNLHLPNSPESSTTGRSSNRR